MFNIIARTLILYVALIIMMRVMGKRQIGELQPYELVLTLMIANLATSPMENTAVPLLYGIVPILTLVFAQILLTFLSLKSEKFRRTLVGNPLVVIAKGRIVEEELHRLRYNLNDLIELLRSKDVLDIGDVEYALVEPSGSLSVILKSHLRPVNAEDMVIAPPYEGLSRTLILDGHINHSNLALAGKDTTWLNKQVQQYGAQHVNQVLLAQLDSHGDFYMQAKKPHKWRRNPQDDYPINARKGSNG